jgi:type IV secretion system protein VirD4
LSESISSLEPLPTELLGNAAWENDFAPFYKRGIPLGVSAELNKIYYNGHRHLITFAPTGGGKFVAVQAPILLEYNASIVAIDPKGEATMVTALKRREMGQKVRIIDPFSVIDDGKFPELAEFKVGFNPLANLKKIDDQDLLLSSVLAISEALIISQGGRDSYFDDTARELVTCLTLEVVLNDQNPTLGKMRRLLTGVDVPLEKTINKMLDSEFTPLAQKASCFLGQSNAINCVISVAISQTSFLDDPLIEQSLSKNDFDFLNLKFYRETVFIILPPSLIIAHSRWFRLLISSSLNSFFSTFEGEGNPVLFMLDECAALGRLPILETALALGRGYGCQIASFWQDLHQLRSIYGFSADSFLANAGVQQYFTPNDIDTAERISKRLGRLTVVNRNYSFNTNEFGVYRNFPTLNFGEISVPLMSTYDLMGLPKDEQILFISGNSKALKVRKNYYYLPEHGYSGFAQNPYYRE